MVSWTSQTYSFDGGKDRAERVQHKLNEHTFPCVFLSSISLHLDCSQHLSFPISILHLRGRRYVNPTCTANVHSVWTLWQHTVCVRFWVVSHSAVNMQHSVSASSCCSLEWACLLFPQCSFHGNKKAGADPCVHVAQLTAAVYQEDESARPGRRQSVASFCAGIGTTRSACERCRAALKMFWNSEHNVCWWDQHSSASTATGILIAVY